jgi:hypothetical protein
MPAAATTAIKATAAISVALLIALTPGPALCQPFGTPGTVLNVPDNPGYVQVASSPALNPAKAITIELYAQPADSSGVFSFLGKGYKTSYWIGSVNGVLESVLAGTGSARAGGALVPDASGEPAQVHIAVTYDGANRRHYIDGELVAVFPETGPLPASSLPLYLGSDPQLTNNSGASIFEVRLWSVARTQAQIRSTMTQQIDGPMPGLVAIWHLAGNATDPAGGHNGGAPQGFAQYVPLPSGVPCGLPQTDACLLGSRFDVAAAYRVFSGPAADGHLALTSFGQASVVGQDDGSAVFEFFGPSDWEILAKMPAGTCALGNRFWFFSAATTNVHYSITVYDLATGTQKVYYNFSGPAAAAVTDTSAFATCP